MTSLKQLSLLQSRRLAVGLCLAWALLLLMLIRPTPAQADGTVTDCTQAGLVAAMNTSGLINFTCGPATIFITQNGGLNVDSGLNYTIDGGGLITLSGGDATRIFYVHSGSTLTLTNITLSHGSAASAPDLSSQGGAILNDGGTLVLNNAIVRDSQSTFAGGAIENANEDVPGTTTLVDSLIENNQSDFGGGIDSIGTLTLINTTVRGNHALTDTGGGLDISGTVLIDNSLIAGNTANNRYGGGIYSHGTLTISNSSLSGNSSQVAGGGVFNDVGTAALSNVTLSGNMAVAGGGIYSHGTLAISNSTLNGNSAGDNGGGIFNDQGALALSNSTLSGNSAKGGGGGLLNEGPATLTDTTLTGNQSTQQGGGIFNNSTGELALINVTLSANLAGIYGGGIANYGAASAFNTTIVFNQVDADNDADGTGGGVYNFSGGTFNLHNSLVAGNRQGTNGTNDCAGTLATYGRNLLYVASECSLTGPAGGSWSFLSSLASIGLLQNNGGPTLTHMPRLGSAIIDGGDPLAGCTGPGGGLLVLDQRGLPRPIDGDPNDDNDGAICDIGAVERQPTDSDLAPRLWLPLVLR